MRGLWLPAAAAVALLLSVACGESAPTALEPLATPEKAFEQTPGAAGTPAHPVNLTVQVADFDENPDKLSGEVPHEGWRVVGVMLDVEYGGGLPDDAFGDCGSENMARISLQASNGAEYELTWTDRQCITLAPGVKVRLEFEGEVPRMLTTIEDADVAVEVGRADGEVYFERTVPMQKDVPFRHGSVADSAEALGDEIALEGGTFRIVRVEYNPGMEADILVECTNDTGYDWAAPVSGVVLVDARGTPYWISIYCEAPPGYTESHWERYYDPYVERGDHYGGPADLSDFVMVLESHSTGQKEPRYYSFHSSVAPLEVTGCPLYRLRKPMGDEPLPGIAWLWAAEGVHPGPSTGTLWPTEGISADVLAAAIDERRRQVGESSAVKGVETRDSAVVIHMDSGFDASEALLLELEPVRVPCP